jgi:hypothetical protein
VMETVVSTETSELISIRCQIYGYRTELCHGRAPAWVSDMLAGIRTHPKVTEAGPVQIGIHERQVCLDDVPEAHRDLGLLKLG